MLYRSTVTALLSVLLLLGGLLTPGAGAGSVMIPETKSLRLAGLPLGYFDGGVAASTPTETPIPFSMVGFELPPTGEVQFRTSVDGQTWAAWATAHHHSDEGPDEGPRGSEDGRRFSAPFWVGEANWLQTRVVGASDQAGPEAVAAHLIDSVGLSRPWPEQLRDLWRAAWRGTQPTAAAAPTRPDIMSREQWGADESLTRGEPSYARRARFGVIHHTAGSNDYTAADAPAVVRGIFRYHTQSRGWSDIGYNLLVDRYGTVYEGRRGGVEAAVIGAHAGGFNTGSFGVALLGTFDAAVPPPAAVDALVELLAWKYDVHHIDVSGTYEATSRGSSRYPSGQQVTLATMSGHRDVSSTACPGGALYSLLPTLRQQVRDTAGPVLLDHRAEPTTVLAVNGRPTADEITFETRLRPAGEWTLEVRDLNGVVVHSDSGEGDVAVSRWQPELVDTGRYTYTFASPGRRSASDYVEFVPPEIRNPDAAPDLVRRQPLGGLDEAVTLTADLYPEASWSVTVTGPDGVAVHTEQGTGEQLRSTWSGELALGAGSYEWQMVSDDAEPASGAIEVFDDLADRVGGDEPVSAAIAVSEAAFPLPLSANHAVVTRSDVFADAMAGGPLAGQRGPVLLTPTDDLDPRVRSELERVLLPNATVYLLGGEQALSEEVERALRDRWRVRRLAGPGRVETAVAVAEQVVEESGATTALIARAGPDESSPWADALAGGAFGAATGQPVLLTDTAVLPEATADALADLAVSDTLVLGGAAAVSDAVLAELPDPRRVAGPDRAATAAAVAEELWGRTEGEDGDRFVVAAGYAPGAWALALAAAPLAARQDAPLLLVDGASLPGATGAYLHTLGYEDGSRGAATVVGGEAFVSEAVADLVSRLLQ